MDFVNWEEIINKSATILGCGFLLLTISLGAYYYFNDTPIGLMLSPLGLIAIGFILLGKK